MQTNDAKQPSNGHKNNNHQANSSMQNPQAMARSKVILKLKQANQQVKTSFKNADGIKTKETVSTFCNGDEKELLIELEKQLIQLGNRYDLFKEGRWKALPNWVDKPS